MKLNYRLCILIMNYDSNNMHTKVVLVLEVWIYLLRYGSHSVQLHDEVAALARHLANNIVEWSHIRALMSS